MPDLGLYIHIPFCRTRCGYCAFNSQALAGAVAPVVYLEAVELELARLAQGWVADRLCTSLFIGGGTPTIYPGAALVRLLDRCRGQLLFAEDMEITVESNPNTVTLASLTALVAGGVNRLSIGVQSLSDRLLTTIGRSHNAAQAMAAVALARQAGFANINLDLIYGLPSQTLADWRTTLETALELAPQHLALYELSVEPGTPFAERAAQGALPLPDDDLMAEMELLAQGLLATHGYQRYEISNYARPGYECRHNLNYWHNGSYLGLGAGAVSSFDGLRLTNLHDPAAYMARIERGLPAFDEGEALGLNASFRESVIMGLRLLAGVQRAALMARYGLDPVSYYGDTVTRLLARGLLALDEERMWLTDRALPVAHQVLAELV
jgi:oxygen-independent coproporphyrinogen-3 oxidase